MDGGVAPPERGIGMGVEQTTESGGASGVDSRTEEIRFRNDMTVELIRHSASDADVLFAARVSTQGESTLDHLQDDPAGSEGLIRYLMRDRHGSPFEHNSMTFFVSAPIFVFREFMRHRIASYNEESGRYRKLLPVFYRPGRDRRIVQEGKPGAYRFIEGNDHQHDLIERDFEKLCTSSYQSYKEMLDAGIAREVARMILPVNIYSSMYVTLNARALMNFLSLRVSESDSKFPSFPQIEIEIVAREMEQKWAELMPLTHAAFVQSGRVAP